MIQKFIIDYPSYNDDPDHINAEFSILSEKSNLQERYRNFIKYPAHDIDIKCLKPVVKFKYFSKSVYNTIEK